MSSLILIPFGKYRNTSFLDIYQKDRLYLQWLNTQPWFQIKFSDMHQSLISFLDDNKEKIVINKDTIIIVNSCGDAKKDRDILKARLGEIK